MIFNPWHKMDVGRELRVPWIGHYRIEEILSRVSYALRSETGDCWERVNINRMQKINNDIQEIGDPLGGIFSESGRIIKSIHAERNKKGNLEYSKLKEFLKLGNTGFRSGTFQN